MSFLDFNFEEVPELKTVEPADYELRCTDAEVRESDKTGGKYVLLRLDIEAFPESKGITHVMMLPTENDDEKQKIRRLNAIREAAEAFGLSYNGGLDTDEFIGQTAWATLGEEESDEYGTQNRVRRFITAK